jgi:hypothetical protein
MSHVAVQTIDSYSFDSSVSIFFVFHIVESFIELLLAAF